MEEKQKIGQEQFHSFVFADNLGWKDLIYDLINSEQLDPWDIDLVLLSQKYLEKIRSLEEANFVLSSKVLIVCSLLLRIKSEILLNHYIKDLDDILFKKDKEEKQELLTNLDFDEDEIPVLLPRTPLPRFKKVSLNELMAALSKAIETETRRTEKKNFEKEAYERTKLFMPKKTPSLIERIKEVHEKIKGFFQQQEKVKFSEFAGESKEDKIYHFIPLLHLDTQSKLWLEQEKYLDEIWILKQRLKKIEDEMGNEIITSKIENEFEENPELMVKDGWESPEENNIKEEKVSKTKLDED